MVSDLPERDTAHPASGLLHPNVFSELRKAVSTNTRLNTVRTLHINEVQVLHSVLGTLELCIDTKRARVWNLGIL
jgi:hypothetical protein